MQKNKIYCGANSVPSGKVRGGMRECLEKRQVRYWGTKSIDSRLINEYKEGKGTPETREKLILKIAGMDGKIKSIKLKLQLDMSKKRIDEKGIEKVNKQIAKLEKDRATLKKKYDEVELKRRNLAILDINMKKQKKEKKELMEIQRMKKEMEKAKPKAKAKAKPKAK